MFTFTFSFWSCAVDQAGYLLAFERTLNSSLIDYFIEVYEDSGRGLLLSGSE